MENTNQDSTFDNSQDPSPPNQLSAGQFLLNLLQKRPQNPNFPNSNDNPQYPFPHLPRNSHERVSNHRIPPGFPPRKLGFQSGHVDHDHDHVQRPKNQIFRSSGHLDHDHDQRNQNQIFRSTGHLDHDHDQRNQNQIFRSSGHLDHDHGHVQRPKNQIFMSSGHLDHDHDHDQRHQKQIFGSSGHIDHDQRPKNLIFGFSGHPHHGYDHAQRPKNQIFDSSGHIDHAQRPKNQIFGSSGHFDHDQDHVQRPKNQVFGPSRHLDHDHDLVQRQKNQDFGSSVHHDHDHDQVQRHKNLIFGSFVASADVSQQVPSSSDQKSIFSEVQENGLTFDGSSSKKDENLKVGEEHIIDGNDGLDKEKELLCEELVESLTISEERSETTKLATHSSRGKDYRSDFSRGHHVSSQRTRYRRRELRVRRDIMRFNHQFLSIYESLSPSDRERSKQIQLLKSLEALVVEEWPNARLHLYGSCANSFGVSSCDIDVCLAIPDIEVDKASILVRLAEILQSNGFQNVQALTRARVPIAKLKDPATNISCDICINNILAVVNTKLLRDYSQIDLRLRQLVLLVKHWAKARGVNDTYQGTLSSYAYVLMCIHFLQTRRPAILPCLQEMNPTYTATVEGVDCAFFDQVDKLQHFGSRNRESISELLWAFFNFWAYHHDYTNDVISVRTGSIISKQSKDWTRRVGNDRHLVCIEDPFVLSHDLGRVVDKFTIKILREEFERAADIMQFDSNPVPRLFEPYVRPLPDSS